MQTRIKELRMKYKFTQADLAQQVSVSRETIVLLEQGRHNPSLKLAVKIANALYSSIEDVFIFEYADFIRT